MFLDWFGDLGAGDKIVVIFSAILFIGFWGILFFYRMKYYWESDWRRKEWEEMDGTLKQCQDDKNFENLNKKK